MTEAPDSSARPTDESSDVVSSADPFSPDHVSHARGRTAGVVAAVVTAALILGGGGYALGARHSGTSGAAGSPEPSRSGISSIAMPRVGAAGDMMIYPYAGHVVFTSSGLSDASGQARAWAYDASAAFSKATVVAAAAALGVAGEPAFVDGSWVVGDPSGSKPSVQLAPDGYASLSFYDPTVTAGDCVNVTPVPEPGTPGSGASGSGASGSGGSSNSGGAVSRPGDCSNPSVAPLGHDEAIRKTRALLMDLGLDADVVAAMTFDVSTDETGGAYVSATRVIDGQATGDVWSISWVGDQPSSLYGAMAPVVSLGSYDVVSPVDAVARLSDPRFGVMYGGGIVPMRAAFARDVAKGAPVPPATAVGSATVANGDVTVSSPAPAPVGSDAAVKQPTPPASVNPGDDIAWPVQRVTITDAHLTLVSYTMPDGAQVLLPAYELTDGHDGSWTVLAVADSSLDFTAPTP
jgi:hypothetical protein